MLKFFILKYIFSFLLITQLHFTGAFSSYLHVLISEFITFKKLEFIFSKGNSFTDLEVLFSVIFTSNRTLMSLLFKEFTRPKTRISFSMFKDLNSIITTEEWDNELSDIIFFIFADKSTTESEDKLIALKEKSSKEVRWVRGNDD